MKQKLQFFIPIWIFKKNPIYIFLMTALLTFGYLKDYQNFNKKDESYLNLFEEENNRKKCEDNYLISSLQLINLRNVYTNELSSKKKYNNFN